MQHHWHQMKHKVTGDTLEAQYFSMKPHQQRVMSPFNNDA